MCKGETNIYLYYGDKKCTFVVTNIYIRLYHAWMRPKIQIHHITRIHVLEYAMVPAEWMGTGCGHFIVYVTYVVMLVNSHLNFSIKSFELLKMLCMNSYE